LSTVSGRNLIADAFDLRHRLPRIWGRVQDGTVAVTSDDPLAADRQAESGIGTLVGRAPAVDLNTLDVSLDEVARALTVLGDTDTHDVRRAKALCMLGNPQAVLDLLAEADRVLDALHDPHTTNGPHDGVDPRPPGTKLGAAVMYVHPTDRHLADQDGDAARRRAEKALDETAAPATRGMKLTANPATDSTSAPPNRLMDDSYHVSNVAVSRKLAAWSAYPCQCR
jgi:hypothetical protein